MGTVELELKNFLADRQYPEVSEARVASRIKYEDRILEKIKLANPEPLTISELEHSVRDIAGTRIVLNYLYQVQETVDFIKANPRWSVISTQEHQRPDTGYRAVHIDLELNTTHFEEQCCEVQIRTLLQEAWATWTHPVYERFRTDTSSIPEDLVRMLKALSDQLHSGDLMADALRRQMGDALQEHL